MGEKLLMKRLRLLILLGIASIVLAVTCWLRQRPATVGAATPAECLDNYYESLQSGDIAQYRRCLSKDFGADVDPRSFEAACRDAKDVKGLARRAGPVENGSPRWVDVEEVRAAGIRRLRYRLRQDDSGSWFIAAIDPPRESAAPIRYGTSVGDEPGETAP
jgi:hypothetical protein